MTFVEVEVAVLEGELDDEQVILLRCITEDISARGMGGWGAYTVPKNVTFPLPSKGDSF